MPAAVMPAPLPLRAAATLIDSALVFLIYASAILAGELVPEGDIDESAVFFPRMAIALGVIMFTFLYFVVPEATRGRTPGKALARLRVVMDDGRPATWRAAIVRNLLRPLDFMWLYALGSILVIATPRRQRLGDMAAHTIVTRD